jgi:hypothetical protein
MLSQIILKSLKGNALSLSQSTVTSGFGVPRGDIPIWLIEVLSITERLPNVLKEADSINVGSEASCGSSNEA